MVLYRLCRLCDVEPRDAGRYNRHMANPLGSSFRAHAPVLIAAEVTGASLWKVLLENSLALTITFIFLTAIIGVLVKTRRKDKCLKLLRGFHVSYLSRAGESMWGDLKVYPAGLELLFDAPYTTRRGLIKTSALIYPPQLETCKAICRVASDLTADEVRKRERQVRRTFHPNMLRRTMRWLRNLLNTLQDAFSKSLNLIIGAIAKTRPTGGVMQSQQGQVGSIGDTLLGAAGNAYEPMLEAHIGKPVVLQIAHDAQPPFELQGYLVDYSQQYLAVFNVDHATGNAIRFKPGIDDPPESVTFTVNGQHGTLTCTGPDAVIVQDIKTGNVTLDLGVTLLPHTSLTVRLQAGADCKVSLVTTRSMDVVCPRSIARIDFGSAIDQGRSSRAGWLGSAPEASAKLLEPDTPAKAAD